MKEFSRNYALPAIGETGEAFDLKATPAELALLQKRLDVVEVLSLEAHGLLLLIRNGVLAEGRIIADLVVTSANTGEPMPLHIDEPFDVKYVHRTSAPGASARDSEGHAAWTLGDLEEDEEELTSEVFDLGETIVQYVILAIPLAPRQHGEEVSVLEASDERPNPFAALVALKDARTPKGE